MICLRPYQEALIEDARRCFRNGSKSVLIVSPCGSGKSHVIAEVVKRTRGRVLFLVHRAELADQIRHTLDAHGAEAEVAMVQTKARNLGDETYALIITDESHHSEAKSYRKIYEHYGSYRLGFTATPVRLGGGGLGNTYASMVLGPSVSQLIGDGFLSPFRCFSPSQVDASLLRTRRGEYTADSREQASSKVMLAGKVVEHWKRYAEGRKTIVYANSVASSKEVAKMFCDAGVRCVHLDAQSNDRERMQASEEFRNGELKVLSNVELFGEGYDVPDCDCVMLLRPTASLALHIQQSMRAMRRDPENPKKCAVILDLVGNSLRHGLPDSPREWSLAPKQSAERTPSISQCPVCFGAWNGRGRVCPYCGHKIMAAMNDAPSIVEVEGMELTELSSLADFHAYARKKGYKPGWAYYQYKFRKEQHKKNIMIGGVSYVI